MLIALVGTVVGLLIGLLTGLLRTTPYSKKPFLKAIHKGANAFVGAYVEVFRGTPMMVQAMVIYWGVAFLFDGYTLPLTASAIFIVSINTGAYMTEIVRGGIISVDKGQFEGAYAMGMTHSQAMFHVVIPQVMRNILPSISNEFVINIKDTSVLNVIGVMELYSVASAVLTVRPRIFQTYFIICVIYFILTFSITKLLRFFEKKLAGSDHYVVLGSQSNPTAEIHVKDDSTEKSMKEAKP